MTTIVKCKSCKNGIKTARKFGYAYCYRCGTSTRLNSYKEISEYEEPKVNQEWAFRD